MRNALPALSHAFTTLDRLGATVPKPLAADFGRLVDLSQKAREFNPSADIATPTLVALAEGRDPASDPDVQAAATSRTLAQAHNELVIAVDARAADFLAARAIDILECFRKPFEAAAAGIEAAARDLGDVDLDSTRDVLARGGTAASSWAKATEGSQAIHEIQQTQKLMAGVHSALAVHRSWRPLFFADAPAEFFDDREATSNLTPWDAARRGFPLSLALPGEQLNARIAGVQQEGDARRRAAEQDEHDAYRRAVASAM